MFEVDVKNVTEKEGRRRRRGPARVWGSDLGNYGYLYLILHIISYPLPNYPIIAVQ